MLALIKLWLKIYQNFIFQYRIYWNSTVGVQLFQF